MTSREEFEAWVAQRGFTSEQTNGFYDEPRVHDWWSAWQASRAELVIELPPTPPVPEDPEEAVDDSHMDAYHSAVGMRHACLKFIEAAGVKVKP
jgi:hypothetical protein